MILHQKKIVKTVLTSVIAIIMCLSVFIPKNTFAESTGGSSEITIPSNQIDPSQYQDLPQGQFSTTSKFRSIYPKMSTPSVTATLTENTTDRGYLDITWNKVDGATSYKVGIFNGVEYDFIDVGDVTTWSTKDQGVWPTDAEIEQGNYKLHTDGLGTELQKDSSLVYKNAYNMTKKYDYSNRLGHFVRVIAVYPGGDSGPSDIVMTMFPFDDIFGLSIEVKQINELNGGLSIDWDSVEGAAGYKIWLYDGKIYHSYDIGNVTNWTSLDKGIWLTQEEINQGKKGLHTDGLGQNLSVDPRPVYQINNPTFPDVQNYYSRVTAYDSKGQTIALHNNAKAVIEKPKNYLVTPRNYEDYLENYDINDAMNSGVADFELAKQAVTDAKVTLETFKNLPDPEQEKITSIFNDAEKMEAIYTGNLSSLGDDQNLVTWEEEEEPIIELFSSGTRTISHTGTLKFAGIKITKYKIVGKYGYNSTGVTTVYETYGTVVYNYNPTVDSDLTYYGGYIKDKKYYGKVIFSYKVGIGDLGIVRLGNYYLKICGNKYGKEWGMFYHS